MYLPKFTPLSISKYLKDSNQASRHLNTCVLDLQYDEIVVTGCSYSCGTEMNDHLLSKFNSENERRTAVWKWGMKNLKLKSKKIKDLEDISNSYWSKLERQNSWPALLQEKLNIPVTNLSKIGASIGHSLITYLEFLKNVDKDKKILTIHQLPYMGRMHIRFDEEHGRIPVLPFHADSKSTFGFAREHFREKINRVHGIYKHRVTSKGYVKKHYWKVLNRLHTLSTKNLIKNFYIFPGPEETLMSTSLECNILLKDFTDFRSNYPKGKFRHPIGPAFNTDMCKIIMSTCF